MIRHTLRMRIWTLALVAGVFLMTDVSAEPGAKAKGAREKKVEVAKEKIGNAKKEAGAEGEAASEGGKKSAEEMKKKAEKEMPVQATSEDVYTALSTHEEFKTLVRLVDAAGLKETLTGKESKLVLFAPTDAAFAKLPEGELAALEANPEGLVKLLKGHLADKTTVGMLRRGEIIKTVAGTEVAVSGEGPSLQVGNAKSSGKMIRAQNGRIVPLDAILDGKAPVEVPKKEGKEAKGPKELKDGKEAKTPKAEKVKEVKVEKGGEK